jgi:hypothetical protein
VFRFSPGFGKFKVQSPLTDVGRVLLVALTDAETLAEPGLNRTAASSKMRSIMGLGVLRKVCSYFRTYFIPLLKQSSNPRTAFIKKRCEAWVARMVPLTQTLPNKIIFPVTVKNRTKACNFETVLVSVVSTRRWKIPMHLPVHRLIQHIHIILLHYRIGSA